MNYRLISAERNCEHGVRPRRAATGAGPEGPPRGDSQDPAAARRHAGRGARSAGRFAPSQGRGLRRRLLRRLPRGQRC